MINLGMSVKSLRVLMLGATQDLTVRKCTPPPPIFRSGRTQSQNQTYTARSEVLEAPGKGIGGREEG